MPENMMNSSHKDNSGMAYDNYVRTFGWCKKHPKYRAKKRPRGLCPRCWDMWILKTEERSEENGN